MDWKAYLQEDEELCWSGRPAPRCYTFRKWIHSVFGLLLLPLFWVWLEGGNELSASRGEIVWSVLPWIGIVISGYFLFGHFLKARMEWERTFYAISSRRVLATGGWPVRSIKELPRGKVCHVKLVPRGGQLGSVYIRSQDRPEPLVFSCIEYPDKPVGFLEAEIRRHGWDKQAVDGSDKV